MYKIEWDRPLQKGSIIKFTINNEEYQGKVDVDRNKYYVICDTPGIFHDEFVYNVFKPLNQTPIEYYKSIFKEDSFSGHWPETSLVHLATVLIKMQEDFEKLNKPSKKKPKLDFSKFRFRIGDTIKYQDSEYKIAGYYFLEGFNNFRGIYGYVIKEYSYGHDGNGYGYDEYGNKLIFKDEREKWFLREELANPIKNNQSNNNLKEKQDGNEIKLQRSKAVVIRGEVPEGCRICSKVHKATISIKPLSHTAIARGDQE